MNRPKSKFNVKRKKKSSDQDLNCVVHFLDDKSHLFSLNPKENGEFLQSLVFNHLGIVEPKYFGLSFGQGRWIEAHKSLAHQLKRSKGQVHIHFHVKYFIENPGLLEESQTRQLFLLQTWADILDGKLSPSPQTSCLLTSYYLQTLVNGFVSESDYCEWISQCSRVPQIAKDNLAVMSELRDILKHQSREEAQRNFLEHVRRVELYGVDLHQAQDSNGKKLQVGVSASGVSVYRNSTRLNLFPWCQIVRAFYKKKQFYIHLQREKVLEDCDTVLGFRLADRTSCKLLWKSCVDQHSFHRLGGPPRPCQVHKGVFPYLRKLLTPTTYHISGRTVARRQEWPLNEGWMSTTYRRYDHLHKIQSSVVEPPRQAWSSAPDITSGSSTDDAKNISRDSPSSNTGAFVPTDRQICFADDDDSPTGDSTNRQVTLPLYLESDGDYRGSGSEYAVLLESDPAGVFGFNVRFRGSDSCAQLSRVLPNSPADLCYPPLGIGDELVSINGLCIEKMTQLEVLQLFRTARHSSLALSLRRPPAGVGGSSTEDLLECEYVTQANDSTAEQSVARIAEQLRTGVILNGFDMLARCRPELSCAVAKSDDNLRRNRYGDIFPYDCNRVKLECDLGDYINASYVNMPLAGPSRKEQGGRVVRYIAAQGPLPHTVEDFWCLVWQQAVPLIVMVTPESERGQVKCHRYWPAPDEVVRAGHLVVTAHFHDPSPRHYAHNQFIITDSKSGEWRSVDHVQYLDWPDHGVPVSATHFLDFVRYVQRLDDAGGAPRRRPTLVHCSAGIGRTGAFILLDTALRHLAHGQAFNPVSIVKLMRDQRAMMVQTSMQFQYVCECIVDSLQPCAPSIASDYDPISTPR